MSKIATKPGNLDGIYHCLLSLTEETKPYPLLTSLLQASAEIAKTYECCERQQFSAKATKRKKIAIK